MTGIWLWLSVAGIGALHGLNPATGWMFAAARGVHARDSSQALRSLVPIAVGHATSVGLVAGAIAIGLAMDRLAMQVLAGVLLIVLAICHSSGHKFKQAPAGSVGLALWSFMMSSAHGAGLMLVPVLMPLCLGNGAAREITASGSLTLALAAVGVHTATMIAVTGLVAYGVCRGLDTGASWLRNFGKRAKGRA